MLHLQKCTCENTGILCISPIMRWGTNQPSGQVRLTQCLTCTFRASCCSTHRSRTQVPAFAAPLSRTGKERGYGRGGGGACTGGYKQSNGSLKYMVSCNLFVLRVNSLLSSAQKCFLPRFVNSFSHAHRMLCATCNDYGTSSLIIPI